MVVPAKQLTRWKITPGINHRKEHMKEIHWSLDLQLNWNRDQTGKYGEDLFQKLTGRTTIRMPTNNSGCDFKFIGPDGQPIEVKTRWFEDGGRKGEAGQFHWPAIPPVQIVILIGLHRKYGPHFFILHRNRIKNHDGYKNGFVKDLYAGVGRDGRPTYRDYRGRSCESSDIWFYQIPGYRVKRFIERLCAWMNKVDYSKDPMLSEEQLKEHHELYRWARRRPKFHIGLQVSCRLIMSP